MMKSIKINIDAKLAGLERQGKKTHALKQIMIQELLTVRTCLV
jgi:hypothetical protein